MLRTRALGAQKFFSGVILVVTSPLLLLLVLGLTGAALLAYYAFLFKGKFADPTPAARVIFEGSPARVAASTDHSTRDFVLASFTVALAWLAVGSLLGEVASVKMHWPDFLSQAAPLTFGRIRPAHLNAMIYGWASNAMFGVSLWLMTRLVRTHARLVPLA